MTQEEFMSEIKSMQASGKSNRDILNGLILMFLDDRIGQEEICAGADYLGFELAKDGLTTLQEQAKERHPDYPAYVEKLMAESKKKGNGSADSLARYMVNALEAGFINDKEANTILSDEGILYLNHMFVMRDDPILNEIDTEVRQKRNQGLSDDDIMEQALEDYRKNKIPFARFALIVSACDHSFSDDYLRLDERKQKKAKLRDMLA
jgi:hypothetical protein